MFVHTEWMLLRLWKTNFSLCLEWSLSFVCLNTILQYIHTSPKVGGRTSNKAVMTWSLEPHKQLLPQSVHPLPHHWSKGKGSRPPRLSMKGLLDDEGQDCLPIWGGGQSFIQGADPGASSQAQLKAVPDLKRRMLKETPGWGAICTYIRHARWQMYNNKGELALHSLVWSAYLKEKGHGAMDQPFGPLSLEKEMLGPRPTPRGSHRPAYM